MKQKEVTIEELKSLVTDKGMSRKEIAEYYGVKQSTIKSLFLHPDLKGIKKTAAPELVLVDKKTEEVIFGSDVNEVVADVEQIAANVETAAEIVEERELVDMHDDNF